MKPEVLIVVYCACLFAASYGGGWITTRIRLGHTRAQLVMSFIAGLMLGVGLLHMLPHSVGQMGSMDQAMLWVIVGLVAMFLLIRAFHVHHHVDPTGAASHAEAHGAGHDQAPGEERQGVSWLGATFGLGLHSIVDGLALAAAVTIEARSESDVPLLGLGTFLAVLLHKPVDSMSVLSLMAANGWSKRSRLWVNVAFALLCPLGALLFFAGLSTAGGPILGAAMAFSAGVFLCIALADLLPEIQFHHHDRLKLSTALLAGVLLSYGIEKIHPHDHGPAHSPSEAHDHHHHHHHHHD